MYFKLFLLFLSYITYSTFIKISNFIDTIAYDGQLNKVCKITTVDVEYDMFKKCQFQLKSCPLSNIDLSGNYDLYIKEMNQKNWTEVNVSYDWKHLTTIPDTKNNLKYAIDTMLNKNWDGCNCIRKIQQCNKKYNIVDICQQIEPELYKETNKINYKVRIFSDKYIEDKIDQQELKLWLEKHLVC